MCVKVYTTNLTLSLRPRPVPPPDDLDEAAKALWRRVQRHLREQRTWQDTDAELLESYVRAIALARTARLTAAASPFVEGSKGQLVAHPGLKVAAEAERDAHRYATALLLTPEARKRHEVKPPDPSQHGNGLPFLAPIA
jgi:P27 family predicted phage terminase small subunit